MISIAERHKYIKEQLSKNGYVRVLDVAEQLGVTGATIRKDLRLLEAQGVLYRTHGSASPVKPHVMDLSVSEKSTQHVTEKQMIARAAQALIKPDDSIMLASGSTIMAFAEILEPVGTLDVVTPLSRGGGSAQRTQRPESIRPGRGDVQELPLSTRRICSKRLEECQLLETVHRL